MGNRDAIAAARRGTQALDAWVASHRAERLDLTGAEIQSAPLRWMNFAGALLDGADFSGSDLTGAYFGPGSISARPPFVSVSNRPVSAMGVQLTGCSLLAATFNYTVLVDASFKGAYLGLANFRSCDLRRAAFHGSELLHTSFCSQDLSQVLGLDAVKHHGPSFMDVETATRASDRISQEFLDGIGIPRLASGFLPRHGDDMQKFYSCFLSHASADQDFCDTLCAALREAGLRVWYAPEDLAGGKKLVKQIQHAIEVFDKLLLVLSARSINSTWVAHEIRWARKREKETGKQVLFPISLVAHETLKEWTLIDEESGDDYASEVRSYYIPDFTQWQTKTVLQARVARLVKDLNSSEGV